MRSLQTAMDIASRHGAAVVFARRSNHFGPISPYNWFAAQKGFASIIGSNATTTIAPWGGSDARLGNSPIGVAVPKPGGDPFMLDMALSVVARAKIREALKRGESIPADWATDPQGRATTDPAVALKGFLQAIGGHKGYGLALWVDLFAGVLSNAAYLTHVKSWVDAPDEPQNLGHFFILIDTRVLGSADWLAQRMTDFASILHASPPIDAGRPVIVPGEIEFDSMRRRQASGIEVDDTTLACLRRHAAKEA
jgi:LDH2 family malate/lactate/ureidoglycolate dehydrogenase